MKEQLLLKVKMLKLQQLSIYEKMKNMTTQYNNIKRKIGNLEYEIKKIESSESSLNENEGAEIQNMKHFN